MSLSKSQREKAEYEALLGAGVFTPQSHSARLLEYVVALYFTGKTTLTEHDIAIEAFGRRPDFDPKEDAVVRVEAHRVRKRLADYYEQEGRTHALRLTIPPGSYLPTFVPQKREALAVVRAKRLPAARKYLAGLAVLLLLGAGALALIPWKKPTGPVVPSLPKPSDPGALSEVRILAGSSAKSYTDRLGQVWAADRYYNDGEPITIGFRKILRTQDPQLFLSARQGRDFSYHIPLRPGVYELRLYFAETIYGEDNQEEGGESSRMFDVSVNGAPLLTNFDPFSDAAGPNTADLRVFKNVSPAPDGKLRLRFSTRFPFKGAAIVNGIEIVPGRLNAMLPIRWVASDSARLDSANRLWQPDQWFRSGLRRLYRQTITGTPNPELYLSERFGHFSYAIPVASGRYSVTLHFIEHWFVVPGGGGLTGDTERSVAEGSRIFDVYCNGIALLRNFDIAKQAGGPLRPVQRTFRHLEPNAQGKLLLDFVPVRDYASVDAIEVLDENYQE